MGYAVKDALLKVTKALPAAAGSVYTSGIALGGGDFLADAEFKVSAPALTTTQLPDTKTMTYTVQHDDDPAFGSPTTLLGTVIVQTGSGGAGAAVATFTFRAPVDVKKNIRLQTTGGAAIGDCSGASATLEALF